MNRPEDSSAYSGYAVGRNPEDDKPREPGYQVMHDRDHLNKAAQKEAIYAPYHRKTVEPTDYKHVDTLLNGDSKRSRQNIRDSEPSEDNSKSQHHPY